MFLYFNLRINYYLFLLDLVTDAFKSVLAISICKRIQEAKYQTNAIYKESSYFLTMIRLRRPSFLSTKKKSP